MKRGFSLTEILSTIVIIGVLAAIAIPGFSKTKEKANVSQAVTYLRAIALAEKIFFAKNGTYACNPLCANVAAVNAALGTEIADGAYHYYLGATNTAFTGLASNGNPMDGCVAGTISIDERGRFCKDGVGNWNPSA